ncbi:hypothetical protein BAUCODRAFT_32925 [Baudoinia panamericana UAMH 10762]|uniref:Uncharacterized protein n=1 Tax=Baudoinia panamericana (strain UAMH 10762) TaxID=717646 RepID=M2ND95_BAUPA|nr:uncharacterized protein BAUCODRAFT_32925 [Baudoinia panamericana UAMH 10762]EMC97184.1 hypothetical protein BAUCODRAFT_32925 [Baudoinia panamericana UAMH 10762]
MLSVAHNASLVQIARLSARRVATDLPALTQVALGLSPEIVTSRNYSARPHGRSTVEANNLTGHLEAKFQSNV